MDALKSRQTWTDGAKSVKWAAMLVSQNSRLFYGISSTHGKTDGRVASGVDTTDASKVIASERRLPAHLESAVGVFRAAEEDHLPLDIIIDADLEQGDLLSQYKVLVLPNAACLSDKAVANIRKFVQNGGGLVAMHESSLYTQSGDSRKNFALADLFGASYIGQDDHTARWPAYTRTVALKMRPHEITSGDVIKSTFNIGMDSVDYIGMASKVKAARGVKVIASLDEKPEAPFLILSERDKGKVAYFAGDIGQSYFTNPYQYERKLLSNSLRWAASEKPTVEVTGPMCLQSTFYQQENGKRTIVHLLNEVNSNTIRALPEGNPSMREEIVPLVRIKVLFRDPAITRVHLEP
ncbi:MAG: ThuA domain-containing protein, partial [Armatimonadota bacterium]